MVFPARDAFRRSVALGEPSSIAASTTCAPRFDDRRPFTRRVSLRASPACSLSAATESAHAGPTPPTDFCNRQRAWAHRLNGSLLAQNPLFRRILLSRCERDCEQARPPELTPRAPEGKAATGRQRSESACTKVAQRPTRNGCQTPHRRSPHAAPGSGGPETTSSEPRPEVDPPRER